MWKAIKYRLNWTVGEKRFEQRGSSDKKEHGGLNCRLLAIFQNTEQPLFTEGLLVCVSASLGPSNPIQGDNYKLELLD